MKIEDLCILVPSYYDIQTLRIAHGNRLKSMARHNLAQKTEAEEHYGVGEKGLLDAEEELGTAIASIVDPHPVWQRWMSRIRGIGPILAGGVISTIERRSQVWAKFKDGHEDWFTDPKLFPNEETVKERIEELGIEEFGEEGRRGIACFDTYSKLWSFFGVGLDKQGEIQRHKAGERSNFSSLRKSLCWKIGQSFMKLGASYRREYESYRARMEGLHPERTKEVVKVTIRGKVEEKTRTKYNDGHHMNMSCRWTAKLFLAHTWMFWREMEGLPTRAPYPIERQGHVHIKDWRDYIDRETKKAKFSKKSHRATDVVSASRPCEPLRC